MPVAQQDHEYFAMHQYIPGCSASPVPYNFDMNQNSALNVFSLFFRIFLLIGQNKIKHDSVINHMYENISRLGDWQHFEL